MVVLGARIHPGEEDNHLDEEGSHPAEEEEGPIHLAAEEVPAAIEGGDLEADPILPAVVEDLQAEDPILLVEAADHLAEDPNCRAAEGVEGPSCPAAGRSQGFVADNHLRMGVEGGLRMTFLVL